MLGSNQSDNPDPTQNRTRRKSMGLGSIWSTPSSESQRHFSIESTSTLQEISPARPPPTPLPRAISRENSQFSGEIWPGACLNVSDTRIQDAAGLGICGELQTNENGVYSANQIHRDHFGTQFHDQFQSQASRDQNGPYIRTSQEGMASCNSYYSPQMNFSSTPNFAHQNVSSQFQSTINISPLINYEAMSHGVNNNSYPRLYNQQQQQQQSQYHAPYDNRRASSVYPSSPMGPDDITGSNNELDSYLPVEGFSRLQLRSDLVSQRGFTQGKDLHTRRYSVGDSCRVKDIDAVQRFPFREAESDHFFARVSSYFTCDPRQRVSIFDTTVRHCWDRDHELLSPDYGLPFFDFDESLQGCQLIFVAFKAGRIDLFYVPLYSDNLQNMQVGDLVIVEADRGSDLGRIARLNVSYDEARILKMLKYLEHQSFSTGKIESELNLSVLQPHASRAKGTTGLSMSQLQAPKAILDFASRSEVKNIIRKSQDEEEACQVTIEVISGILSTNEHHDSQLKYSPAAKGDGIDQMGIVDAEYQYDRKKLTIYFTSQRRVNFRDLLPELFRSFKARIWLEPSQGNPVEHDKEAAERRRIQTLRNEKNKGGYNRGRSCGRVSGQSASSASGSSARMSSSQQSPEVGNVRSVYSRKPVQEYSSIAIKRDSVPAQDNFQSSKKVTDSEIPRSVKDENDHRHADVSEGEEKCVMKSLVDTLNH